jgi:hypothetical protein
MVALDALDLVRKIATWRASIDMASEVGPLTLYRHVR